MANDPDLVRKATGFASDTQELLNSTICDYVRCDVNVDMPDNTAIIGTGITRRFVKSEPARLRSTAELPLWLDVFYVLTRDQDDGFLMVKSSVFGISVGEPDSRQEVLHYDYERDKDEYPEAHIQFFGSHPLFIEYAKQVGAKDQLGRFHLPVGGRRLRPCLEDVIEFLVVEKLVTPHDGWADVLIARRKAYRRKQIEALVRRNHGTARGELERIGFTVISPKDQRKRARLARYLMGPAGMLAGDQKKTKGKKKR